MARNEGYDWIDDAFDAKKEQEELEEARVNSRSGCLLVAALLIAIAFVVIAFIGLGALNGLSNG